MQFCGYCDVNALVEKKELLPIIDPIRGEIPICLKCLKKKLKETE